jgi:hypothetical protein
LGFWLIMVTEDMQMNQKPLSLPSPSGGSRQIGVPCACIVTRRR